MPKENEESDRSKEMSINLYGKEINRTLSPRELGDIENLLYTFFRDKEDDRDYKYLVRIFIITAMAYRGKHPKYMDTRLLSHKNLSDLVEVLKSVMFQKEKTLLYDKIHLMDDNQLGYVINDKAYKLMEYIFNFNLIR